jgi:tetratricopeptide (TPR) repeat protein
VAGGEAPVVVIATTTTTRLQFHSHRVDPSFAVVRFLVEQLSQEHETSLSPRAARLLGLSADPADAGPISLTDGVGPRGQIRYNLHRRTRRILGEIAELLARGLNGGLAELVLCNPADTDAASQYFLDVASGLWPELSVRFQACSGRRACSAPVAHDTVVTHDATQIIELAWHRLRVGDPWGCQALLQRLLPEQLGARGHQAMATALVALELPTDAEQHFHAWMEAGDALNAARAKYGLAMLKARFHRPELRSDAEAAEYLESALYDLSLARSQNPDLDTTFEEVFNRNGFALIEFRRGRIDEALKLLETGLLRLPDTSERNHLHRSVLLYNIAQVHRRVGDHAQAVESYQEVLALDPNMPEYHCELALSLLALGRADEALAHVRIALALDPYIPESHSLEGYVLAQMKRTRESLASHRRALELARTPRNAYAYAFYSNQVKEHLQTVDILGAWANADLGGDEVANFSALKAEALISLGREREALEELERASAACPDNPRIGKNLALARAGFAASVLA